MEKCYQIVVGLLDSGKTQKNLELELKSAVLHIHRMHEQLEKTRKQILSKGFIFEYMPKQAEQLPPEQPKHEESKIVICEGPKTVKPERTGFSGLTLLFVSLLMLLVGGTAGFFVSKVSDKAPLPI